MAFSTNILLGKLSLVSILYLHALFLSPRMVKSSLGVNRSQLPPLIVDDLIFIGPAGLEWAGKCWIGAFRLSDGQLVWKFNTVPDLGEPGTETWGNNPTAIARRW